VSCRTMREFSAAELNLLAAIGSQIAATIDKSLLLDETRQAYDNLRRTQEQLLQSEKMAAVGQLISGVAHELNNPLTAILGYSQLLGSGEHTSPPAQTGTNACPAQPNSRRYPAPARVRSKAEQHRHPP
jgi:signal transduction histidine kinase